jgi:hypothetical protein
VNQLRAEAGKGPIGHLGEALYALPDADFNDAVPLTFGAGENTRTVDSNESVVADFFANGAIPGMPVTAGYDLATGRGSPRAYDFVHDLADAR